MKVFRNPLTYSNFVGMNNVTKSNTFRVLGEDKEAISSHIVLNMDATAEKSLVKIKGASKFLNLPYAHSLFSVGRKLFVCAEGISSPESLWLVDTSDKSYHEVCPVTGRGFPLYYVNIDNLVFMSSKLWNGVYDFNSSSIREWGTTLDNRIDVIDDAYDSDVLLTVGVTKVPCMTNLLWFASRIWGIKDNKVLYTDPLAYFWFKPENIFEFPDKLTMLASIEDGLYVASPNRTWFLHGRDVDGMVLTEVGKGAVSGTLSYCSFKGESKIPNKTPFWVNKSGICAGVEGREINLTGDKLTFPVSEHGASVFRLNRHDSPQYLVNFPSPVVDSSTVADSLTIEVFRNGKLIK